MIAFAMIGAVLTVLLLIPAERRSPRDRPMPAWLAGLLSSNGVVSPRRRLAGGLCAGVVASLIAGVWWWVASPVGAIAVFVVLGRVESGSRRRHEELLRQQLPHALDLLAACLEAGVPVHAAVGQVAAVISEPLREELAVVARRFDAGAGEEDAWRASGKLPVVGPVMRDIGRSARSGTAVAEALARHARDTRRQAEAARLARAKAVGVRSVLPTMACFLPAFLLLGIVPVIASALQHFLR